MSIESVMLSIHRILCRSLLLSSCFQSFPASGSFPMSQFFTSSSQSIGVSASFFPMSIQDWFPLGLTDVISLLSKRLSRVFSNTTVGKDQFFSAQPSLWSNSHIHIAKCHHLSVFILCEADKLLHKHCIDIPFWSFSSTVCTYLVSCVKPMQKWISLVQYRWGM